MDQTQVKLPDTATIFIVDIHPAPDSDARLSAIQEELERCGMKHPLSSRVYYFLGTVEDAVDKVKPCVERYLSSPEDGVLFFRARDAGLEAQIVAPVKNGPGPTLIE